MGLNILLAIIFGFMAGVIVTTIVSLYLYKNQLKSIEERAENRRIVLNTIGKLSATIDKPVVLNNEDGYFKVQIIGFKNLEEIEKILLALGLLGQKDFWVHQVKKKPEVLQTASAQPDTFHRVVEEKAEVLIVEETTEIPEIEEKQDVPEPTIALQVGIFHKKNEALRVQRKITSKLNLPVDIVTKWDCYHVIVPGFFTREETYKYYPELAQQGIQGTSLIENYRKPY